jgi:hypothetical protein
MRRFFYRTINLAIALIAAVARPRLEKAGSMP